jgi:hypothetical protein
MQKFSEKKGDNCFIWNYFKIYVITFRGAEGNSERYEFSKKLPLDDFPCNIGNFRS